MSRINRNHYFAVGTLLLLLGLQLRFVDTFVLNEPASQFVQKRLSRSSTEQTVLAVQSFLPASAGARLQPIKPPKWIGWVFMSMGAVLILHAIPMNKPG